MKLDTGPETYITGKEVAAHISGLSILEIRVRFPGRRLIIPSDVSIAFFSV
jgi:hypothetical protein